MQNVIEIISRQVFLQHVDLGLILLVVLTSKKRRISSE